MSDSLIFTEGAAQKVKSLMAEESSVLHLRVYIVGGGCSGFSYGFQFDEHTREDDIIVCREDVNLLVDPMSYQYLKGACIDYQMDFQGERFVIQNPNAVTTCGCGSSFALADPAPEDE